VTMDVSFISLTKIFPAVDRILSDTGDCVCLIKPQFEAPQKALGKNGILKDPSILPDLFLSIIQSAATNRLFLRDMSISPIHGTNGNVEYLAHFSRTPRLTEEEITALVHQTAALQVDEEQ